MHIVQNVLLYVGLFTGLYFQVFLLFTFLGWKKDNKHAEIAEADLPTVSVLVPCFNESKTVVKTVHSILDLNYPKEKLFVIVVDDGSTDNTWETIQMFATNPQVKLLTKQNEGGKYAALNFGLPYATTDVIGCLDADSRVDTMALRASVREFSDPEVMAVVPSMVIDAPSTFFQWMQKVEYELGVYTRRAFSHLNSLYIAPGPFTLFKREVFDKLGPYKEAYHVEDLAIALDMQSNGMKLVHAMDSLVYTHGPRNWGQLLKQRVRWTFGFIKNVGGNYRHMLFKRKLGNLGMFVLPFASFSLLLIMVTIPLFTYLVGVGIYKMAVEISVGSFHLIPKSFTDIFYTNTQAYVVLSYLGLILLVATVLIARKSILGQKKMLSLDLLSFIIYPYFSMVWTAKSFYNAARSKKESWR